MDDFRLQELIQADLDGELTTAERAELARLLLQRPDARHLRDDLMRTHTLLRQLPQAEPPAGLRPAILGALGLPLRSSVPSRRAENRWSTIRFAAAIAGVLIAAAVGYNLLDSGQPQGDLQGSLGATMPSAAVDVDGALGHAHIQSEGIDASATLRRSGGGLRLELDLAGTAPYELVASFDPAATEYIGDGDETGLVATTGRVTIEFRTGHEARVLKFSRAAPIRIQVRAAGQVLQENVLSFPET